MYKHAFFSHCYVMIVKVMKSRKKVIWWFNVFNVNDQLARVQLEFTTLYVLKFKFA